MKYQYNQNEGTLLPMTFYGIATESKHRLA